MSGRHAGAAGQSVSMLVPRATRLFVRRREPVVGKAGIRSGSPPGAVQGRAGIARDCARWWVRAVVAPRAVMAALPRTGWPRTGLAAAAIRFSGQDLVETLPLAVLGREPFMPTRLPIRPERHYRAQAAYLPAFGLAQWLLMGSTATLVLRLRGERRDLARVLDVVGVGMLVPMPVLWMCDAVLISSGRFRMPELALVNPAIQVWETALIAFGLRTTLGSSPKGAVTAACAASTVYVLGASQVLR